tara:strand:+ start:71 stop:637 length:567 start_codon:yes stop_codon:yes gene_type:complete
LKIYFVILFFFINSITLEAKTAMLILDKLETPGKTTQGQFWSFFTDGVMGGISEGSANLDKIDNIDCYRMQGNVTTENNGGFIQIRVKIVPNIVASDHDGIYLKIFGNSKKYFLHLRTPFTLAPWQYYSYSLKTENKWTEIKAPFKNFKKSNFYQPENLFDQKIKSIGLVAGFDDFEADVCLAEIGFY